MLHCDPILRLRYPTWTTNSLGRLVGGVLLTDQGMVRLEVEKPTLCDSWLEVVHKCLWMDADWSQGELYEHIDYCFPHV